MAMTPDEIHERLGFARRRMDELLVLNAGDLGGADPSERQQLVQEFFFHLVGAIELLAHLANERRGLGLTIEDVSVPRVSNALPEGDALRQALQKLYANTRPGKPVPDDLYCDDGLVYRIWNYRHQVTHRRRNPFQFNMTLQGTLGTGPTPARPSLLDLIRRTFRANISPPAQTPATAHFKLDPRNANSLASAHTAQAEMERMLELVTTRCEAALRLIP